MIERIESMHVKPPSRNTGDFRCLWHSGVLPVRCSVSVLAPVSEVCYGPTAAPSERLGWYPRAEGGYPRAEGGYPRAEGGYPRGKGVPAAGVRSRRHLLSHGLHFSRINGLRCPIRVMPTRGVRVARL
jgi:hypothetical protein